MRITLPSFSSVHANNVSPLGGVKPSGSRQLQVSADPQLCLSAGSLTDSFSPTTYAIFDTAFRLTR
jgi:hypothetical protein